MFNGIKRIIKLSIILYLSRLTEWFIKKFYPDFRNSSDEREDISD